MNPLDTDHLARPAGLGDGEDVNARGLRRVAEGHA
jgi:hypothetical protein